MKLATVVLALAFATSASAEPKHWYKDKKWWIGEAVIAAAVAADYHSTAIQRGTGRETNMLLGPSPSNRRLVIVGSSAFGYWTALHVLDWHFWHDDPVKGWRTFGYTAIPVAAAAIHGSAAIHNYELPAAVREGLVKP